jgi:outer membrane protein assembly factor BamB
MQKSEIAAFFLAIGHSLAASLLAAGNWPDFRGPRGDGHSAATDLPLRWNESDNVRWKIAIEGRGWSSPVVWGQQVWMTTASEDGRQLSALAVDLETGRMAHNLPVFEVAEPQPIDPTNSYASPSPLIEEGRVFVHFGTYGTACIDTTGGRILWSRRDFPVDHQKGPGSSPVLFENLMIFSCDGNDVQYMVALEKTTGCVVWRTERSADLSGRHPDYRKSFSTPLIHVAEEQPLLISTAAGAVYGYDPRTGRELWRVRYGGHTNVARPLAEGSAALINTGFARPELWAVRLGGSGDVTETNVLWRVTRGVSTKPSPLWIDGLLFMVTDSGGLVTCLDAATGQVLATRRLGGNYAASPLYAPGRIYLFSEEGRTTVLSADEHLCVLAENRLDDGFLASPAVSGRTLVLRTRRHLYRIQQAAEIR